MKTKQNGIFKDVTFLIGIILILLSLGVFMLPEWFSTGKTEGSDLGIFILNYLISIIYFIVIWIREISRFNLRAFHENLEYGFIHLILCLISAYSLNREIPVFQLSTLWLQIALVAQGVLLVLIFFRLQFPSWLQWVHWSLLGVTFSLFLYYSIFLISLYPVGFIAFPFFGLSLHAFVPLWIVASLLLFLFRKDNRNRLNITGFFTGIILSITVTVVYIVQWQQTNRIIARATDKSLLDEKNDLPEWTVIAQRLPKNALSERILKTELVYSVPKNMDDWGFFDMPNRNFNEVKKHDPLVMLATFFLGKPNLIDDQKIKILESMYDSRHQAQERLWSGDNLQTSHVLTNVRLYPSLRIGYTEKIITIRNNGIKHTWRPQEEAIYTFHLPEGGVVTSLSLWINGKEETGVLTAKHKADSAYKTIVGKENRDPSLVRWQEGNTVSVRVFPCTPNEDRRFKIGITAPLIKEKDKLAYQNIWFDGPSPSMAEESVKINTTEIVNNLAIPDNFQEESANTWFYTGSYKADWIINIPVTPIKPNGFCFDGKMYQVSEYQKTYQTFDPQNIYLDVNNQWTHAEWEAILRLTASKNVYAFHNQHIKITPQNEAKLFEQLTKLNFSIFPIYEITNPKNSLLITKGSSVSPNITDLGECEFVEKLKKHVTQNGPVKLFNLSNELSPYLKTLKELRVFEFDAGTADDLSKLLTEKKFVSKQENQETVVINDAGIKISEIPDTTRNSNAPDHLMRLFAYNNVMFQTGTNYFNKDFYDPAIVDKAYKAYVVSPATSLVVLETKQDYERFNIKNDGKSLQNASMKSSGAVPEPHEWVLIIILASIAIYLYLKSSRKVLQ
jgi:XrtN system VIT domain protein